MPPKDDTRAYEPVECPKCGGYNPAHLKYCGHCGHPLAERAPHVRAMLEGIEPKDLIGKEVITEKGLPMGKVVDTRVEEGTIKELHVSPPTSFGNKLTRLVPLGKRKKAMVSIPWSSVRSVRDFVVIEESPKLWTAITLRER